MQQRLGDYKIIINTPAIPPLKQKPKMKRPLAQKTTYSHSRLSTFEQCKLKFKFGYIDKVETEIDNTIEGFMGSTVHDALEKLYKDLRYQKLNTKDEIIGFFHDQWDKNWNENILIVKKEYTKENYRRMGEKYLSDYYDRFAPFDTDTTIAIEQRIIIDIGGKSVQGIIDRLSSEGDGTYVIHDYKTSGTLMTQEYTDKDRQLALYAIAVKEQYQDCKDVKLIWHFLAFDKDVVSTRTDEQLEELKGEIQSLIEEIEATTTFPPTISALCGWCQFRPLCPNFKHQYLVEDLRPDEFRDDDGVKLVNRYAEWHIKKLQAEQELENVKQALVAFGKDTGMDIIQGSDYSALIRSYPSLSFPKKDDPRLPAFTDTIKKLGLFDDLAQVNVYELAKRMNNKEIHPEFITAIERFAERGTNDRVYLRKKI